MPVSIAPALPGESPGDKIARLVRHYVGCSIHTRSAELGALVARGVDDPKLMVTVKTNCGTSALGILAEAGAQSPVLARNYLTGTPLRVTGNAIAWLIEMGIQRRALVKYTGVTGMQPKVGSLLHYRSPTRPGVTPVNDDHVEFLLTPIDARGYAMHGGGGRADNAITMTSDPGLVTYNNGRPLLQFWDPDLLGIEVQRSSVPPEPETNNA